MVEATPTKCETSSELPKLKVLNTFTGEKDEFIPSDPHEITWYQCGPTVYSDSHMGHARTYMSFDIMRRIMTDFFGYNVKMVMNITDVDDKIINKSNEAKIPFHEIAKKYEGEFFDDMRQLNVALPDVITRVSEYVDEIADFIQKIIDNGFAYHSNGSVYFNVEKFIEDPQHQYAKLDPSRATSREAAMEGEGNLDETRANDKQSERDFALWKNAKAGEPSWKSPWGQGRPGWHIECSAMASAIFDKYPIDIHCGGIDLKFPHHDNEVAQSEAYYNCNNWINYFWHTGHMNIDGLKMSKSLKNFITIKATLENHSAKAIRMMFLIHNWSSMMTYDSDKSLTEASVKVKQFSEFFLNVKANLRNVNLSQSSQKWTAADKELSAQLLQTKKNVYAALADSFNTPKAVQELSTLIGATNTYMTHNSESLKEPLLKQVTAYIEFVLKSFGMPESEEEEKVNMEQAITPLMDIASKFRDRVKEAAGDKKLTFQLCDQVRDEDLPHVGIRLEDKGGNKPAVWKFADPKEILAEMKAKADKKQKAEDEKRAKKEAKDKEESTHPSEWFKAYQAEQWCQFDAQGLPSHKMVKEKDSDKMVAQELKKEELSKVKKAYAKQEKTYTKWVAANAPKEEVIEQKEEI